MITIKKSDIREDTRDINKPANETVLNAVAANQARHQSIPVLAIADNPFSRVDSSVVQRIGELSLSSAMALLKTSQSLKKLFSVNHKILAIIDLKRDLLRQLLGHAALGELADAEEIWQEHPDLLTCYGTIFHPNRIYNGNEVVGDIPFHHNPGRYKYENRTALQILWMNEEYEDAKRIEDIIAPEEMKRQFLEVFPDRVIKKDKFDLEEAKRLLKAAFDAIIHDSSINAKDLDVMNEETRAALNALYAYAKPKSKHKTGLVFDANFYLAALTLYDNKAYDQFKQQWAKYDFWCIRVEEWLAGCLGTGYLRPHAQGLGNNFSRRGCDLADGSSSFAFRRGVHSLPGLHFFVGYFGGAGRGADIGRARWAMGGPAGRVFENYVKQKTTQRATYASVQLKP